MNQTIKSRINDQLDRLNIHDHDQRQTIKEALVSVAELSYQEGQENALESFIPLKEVARRLGKSERVIAYRAKALTEHGVKLGYKFPGETGLWLFRESDIDLISQIKNGRPGRKKLC